MSLEEMEWSISIAEEEDSQECGGVIFLIVMVYSRASTSTLGLFQEVYLVLLIFFSSLSLLETKTGWLSAVLYFTLDSEANEDPPEFTLTCQSREGPVTEVKWGRIGVGRVEEDSNHTTSQIIVNTSANTVYNNTLRVRGRESGLYMCNVGNNRHEYIAQDDSQSEFIAVRRVRGIYGVTLCLVFLFVLVSQEPLGLNAIYKTPTIISLEWTFPVTPVHPYSYVAYYQSGGEGYSVAFTTDSFEIDNRHELTGLPVGGVHSISLVALDDLPSPVAGPVTPGEYTMSNISSPLSLFFISVVEAPVMVNVSGSGLGVAETQYSLICRVRLPPGVDQVSPNIRWKRPNMLFTHAFITAITSTVYLTTLLLPSLQSSDAGEYLCQASYSLGGYTSLYVNDSFIVNVISKFIEY